MLLGILLTIHILVCIALIAVVLLQRSEGGALGMGGGPSGFMTARGAGDLLTRTTWILGAVFFALSLILTLLAGREGASSSVVDRVNIQSIDPNKLNQAAPPPVAPAPDAAPASPSGGLQAPRPTLRNPILDAPAETTPAQSAPAGAPSAPQSGGQPQP
jgi:preprotein translocase subunit SecG